MRFTLTLPVAGDGDGAKPGGAPARGATVGRDPTRILLVDDDPAALRCVGDALETAGNDMVATGKPGEVEELVLLDLVLPGTDGIKLMESLPALADLPVIFISACGRDETVVRALESGAVDCIVKPFSPTELVARVSVALRVRIDPEPFVLGDLEIRHERRRVTVAGREVRLTATEYGNLRLLSTRAGRSVTCGTVLRQLRDGRKAGSVGTVRTFVKKLRANLRSGHALTPVLRPWLPPSEISHVQEQLQAPARAAGGRPEDLVPFLLECTGRGGDEITAAGKAIADLRPVRGPDLPRRTERRLRRRIAHPASRRLAAGSGREPRTVTGPVHPGARQTRSGLRSSWRRSLRQGEIPPSS